MTFLISRKNHYLYTDCRRIVQKDGPNKGRPFYSCPKSINESCKFFQWADENGGNTYNVSGGQNKGTFREEKNLSKRRHIATGKRKCGICGTEGLCFIVYNVLMWNVLFTLWYMILFLGHTRRTCPENAMD